MSPKDQDRYRRRRPDREQQRRRQKADQRAKQEHQDFDPAPPTEDDWVIGDGSGLRRITGPEPVGDAVDAFLGRTNWRERVAATRLLADWPALVGQNLADHCTPVRIDRGVLVIAAESHAWATQLTWLESTIREKVNEAARERVVQKVKVIVGDERTTG